jgi:hypothetical protein
VQRGQDVPAGAVLVKINNPETITEKRAGPAARVVAEAQLANIHAGTRTGTHRMKNPAANAGGAPSVASTVSSSPALSAR